MNTDTENKIVALEFAPPVRLRKVRHSKIGRLPRPLQEQLCHRLEEGQTAADILNWVNALPEVSELLEREFDGRPITPQNLSDWRMDGYLEWVRIQEAREHVDSLKAQGELLGGKEQNELGNQIARVYAIELFATLRAGLDATQSPLERLEVLHRGLQDIKGLRQWDHATARAAMQRERWEFERLDLADARKEKDKAAEDKRKADEAEAKRLEKQWAETREVERMLLELEDDGFDVNKLNGHESLLKAYAAMQARKAGKGSPRSGKECIGDPAKSREIVQNRGKSNFEGSLNRGMVESLNRAVAPDPQPLRESKEIVQNPGKSNVAVPLNDGNVESLKRSGKGDRNVPQSNERKGLENKAEGTVLSSAPSPSVAPGRPQKTVSPESRVQPPPRHGGALAHHEGGSPESGEGSVNIQGAVEGEREGAGKVEKTAGDNQQLASSEAVKRSQKDSGQGCAQSQNATVDNQQLGGSVGVSRTQENSEARKPQLEGRGSLNQEEATKVVEALCLKASRGGFRVPKSVEVAALRAYLTSKEQLWFNHSKLRNEIIQSPAIDPRLDPQSPWHGLWKKLEGR